MNINREKLSDIVKYYRYSIIKPIQKPRIICIEDYDPVTSECLITDIRFVNNIYYNVLYNDIELMNLLTTLELNK